MNCNEDLEPTLLEKSELLKLAQPFPVCCGIYFLFDGEEIVYVGQSQDVCKRIGDHREKKRKHPPKVFDKFAFIFCESEKLDALETFYITKYNPKYNNNLSSGLETKWKSVDWLRSKYLFNFRYTEFYRFLKEYNLPIVKKRIDVNVFNAALLKKFGTIEPKIHRQH